MNTITKNMTRDQIALSVLPEQYRAAAVTETHIMWSRNGGSYTAKLNTVIQTVKAVLDAGETPDFPNTRWNDTVVLREKMRREGEGIVG